MPRPVRIGEMDQRVTIRAPHIDVNADGTWDSKPDGTDQWWCKIEPLTGEEGMAADSIYATAQYKVTGFYYDGLSSEHQLVNGSQVLEIVGPPLDLNMRGEIHVAYCKEAT